MLLSMLAGAEKPSRRRRQPLQKSFHPRREKALHRGSDTDGLDGRAEGPAGGRASPASGVEGGMVGDEAAEVGRTL